jgi:putative nucleotidyltransferase with HDIG domain
LVNNSHKLANDLNKGQGEARKLPYPVDQIIDNSSTDFDLFIKVDSEWTLYAGSGYHWTLAELNRLLQGGHKNLYYNISDQRQVEAYKAVYLTVHVDESAPPRERIIGLTDTAATLTKILYQHPVTPAAITKIEQIAKAMVNCIEEDLACVAALGKLASHDDYTYYHSARVCAYALAIASQMSQTDRLALTDMATGALLHDIGKSKIDLSILHKRGALTPQEWDTMRQHPEFGSSLIEQTTLSLVPKEIIVHHHEKPDGSGYPHNLTSRELLEEVKIVNFADIFDALTTNRPYQFSRTHFEALDFIRHRLSTHVHKESYEAIITILGGTPATKK